MNGELLKFSPGSEVRANTMFYVPLPHWNHELEHFPGTWAGLPTLPQCIPDSWLSPASAVSLWPQHVPGTTVQLQSFRQSGPSVEHLKPLDYACSSSGNLFWAVLVWSTVGLPDCYLLQLQLACQSCLDPYIGVTPSRPGEVAVSSHS